MLPSDVRDTKFFHQLLGFCFLVLPRVPSHLEDEKDVFLHRQLAEYRRLLGEIADTVPGTEIHWHLCDVLTVEENASGAWTHQADDHVEGGRLPCPVLTKQADDFALLYV